MASEHRFGFEWERYSHLTPEYETQFKNWVTPFGPADFRGKTVLDAGCGMGRNSYWALRWGAKKVTAFDFDERSVAATRRNLAEFSQTNVLFSSIYDISWHNEFDIAMSIGVVHHLEDPRKALSHMAEALKPGGMLLIWVYSYEGNEWILKYVDPIRKHITSKLPVSMVYWLSYGCSLPLWLYTRFYWGTKPYIHQLSESTLSQIHNIVFDQLIPTVSNYWNKHEVFELVSTLPVENIRVHRPPHDSGWTLLASKK